MTGMVKRTLLLNGMVVIPILSVRSDIRQGGILSPLLFNIIIY